MKISTQLWTKIAIINLLIVASLGVLMRYKIGFDFPYFSQKYILHSHSHFAFSGWVTHAIYILLVHFITHNITQDNTKLYNKLIFINLICSYGMLISFFTTGYSFISIGLSTATIVNNCFFAYFIFKDFKKLTHYHPSIAWFKSALWFNIFSSLGTFYLAYMMACRNFNEHWYLASVYYYLHFQYNGFFTFTCLGLIINKLPKYVPHFKYNKLIFILFFTSSIPSYFLSILWAKIPMWLYIIVVISAIVQLIGWVMLLKDVRKFLKIEHSLPPFSKIIFMFVSLAFTIKLLLQLGSTIPEISKLAFGFRPVVIAYLHLVLLGVISVFLLAYFYTAQILHVTKITIVALSVFLVGVFLNELVLGIQGVASFMYFPVKHINEYLFVVAIIIFIGMLLLVYAQTKHKQHHILHK